MEVEKRSSKGGFLQLFDWNVKSRKKLFSDKSELSESSKQGRESYNDSTILQLRKVNEYGCGPSTKGNTDLDYASSVNGDERYGSRAPGVVARLMGLDSLPTSNASGPCFTPSFNSHSFRDSHSSRGIPDFRSEEHMVIYDSMRNKLDGFTKNPVEVMLQKVQSRPIERFQTEVLPPKSAKPISITHHKLLSPIKSPGFIPTMNAAYLMEAAAKIIEQSPRSTATHKLPSLGSSTVPFGIHDLKEKMEAAQKSTRILEASQKAKGQNSSKHIKRQPRDSIQGRGEAPDMFRVSDASRNAGSQSLKNKEKSVSLAMQAKANVQKKDGFTSVGNRSFINQKEHSDVKYSSASRNQPNSQKNVERRTSMKKPSDVLRQNNQKQNYASDKEREVLRPSFSHKKDRKPLSTNDVPRPSKIVNKIVVNTPVMSKKTSINLVGKEQTPLSMKKSSAKKQPVNGNGNSSVSQGENSIKCNFEIERCTKQDAAERKNGMDVVSFTFTSPIKKSLSASSSPVKVVEKKRSSFILSSTSENQSSYGLNLSGGDALSMLLEQKLKELTSKVESSNQDLVPSEFLCSSSDCFRDSESSLNMAHTKSAEHDKKTEFNMPKDKPGIQCKFDSTSVDEPQLKALQMCEGAEEMGEHSSISNSGYERELRYQYCGPLSSLEPAYSDGSCNSLDSNKSINSEASKKFLSVGVHEMTQWSSTRKSRPVEADIELSDSASSTSLDATTVTDISSSFTSLIANEPPQSKLGYIKCILVNADLMLEEFALGQVHRIVAPDLFIQLGEETLGSDKNVEENFKLARKVLFDYVEESLQLRCAQLFSGSRKDWAKSTILFRRKDWLAEELCREISGWTSMEDFMVDELVDKDMSTQLGKWVDFETEAFEEGAEIEKGILSFLVDELVDDFSCAEAFQNGLQNLTFKNL